MYMHFAFFLVYRIRLPEFTLRASFRIYRYQRMLYLTAAVSHFRSPESIPPALSENFLRINVHLNSELILKVQFLHDENSGVIGSVPE